MIKLKNVLTVDVEDYFQVAALSKTISMNDWDSIKPRVYENTMRILKILDRYEHTCTFFILGWVADRFPELVKEIDKRGHEVASHGYSHQLVYNQTPEVFYSETLRSKEILENIISKPISGYRAASYSITKKSLWALDILSEIGFEYDSSIFPVYHDRYGIANSPLQPYNILTPNGLEITEYPLSVFKLWSYHLPIAGGGYFRLYPYWLTNLFYKTLNKSNTSFVFYLHPWEMDVDQPKVKAGLLSKFRHYNNLNRTEPRFINLMNDFEFIGMKDYIDTHDIKTDKNTILVNYKNESNENI